MVVKRKVNIAPVLLFAFRRPESTKKVFEQIRIAKPSRYFLYVDGPRNNEEKIKVDLVKKIASNVDWPCEFKTFFRTSNAGINGGLDVMKWFIEKAVKGIILEDDAVPNQDFFRFCSDLLDKYKDDERIMYINGCNFQRGWSRDESSYYFSKYPHPKGFAIWKRSWDKYDYEMRYYLEFIKYNRIGDVTKNKIEKFILKKSLSDAYYKLPEAADIRWLFTLLTNNGLAITPNKNLVRDIGFEKDAEHMRKIDSYYSLPSESISFPLKHPKLMIRDDVSDVRHFRWLFTKKFKKHFLIKTWLYKLLNL
ncbi:MAG TPA: hypothetical protein VJH92_01910 [Candidatus Nanoarchaeia archaeon]|nr:hypothetical protein [Candidatus Nanoarchaeia archaeon]